MLSLRRHCPAQSPQAVLGLFGSWQAVSFAFCGLPAVTMHLGSRLLDDQRNKASSDATYPGVHIEMNSTRNIHRHEILERINTVTPRVILLTLLFSYPGPQADLSQTRLQGTGSQSIGSRRCARSEQNRAGRDCASARFKQRLGNKCYFCG
jgi:hypothetical protein